MFGALVFALPFEHEGGNLVLRHRTRAFTFDTPALLQAASSPNSSASVENEAIYSAVEHNVL